MRDKIHEANWPVGMVPCGSSFRFGTEGKRALVHECEKSNNHLSEHECKCGLVWPLALE